MSNVFTKYLESSNIDENGRPKQLVTISSVCNKWHTVARETPSLWTNLDTRSTVSFNELALENSGAALISLTGPVNVGTDTRINFLKAGCHMARWHSVDLTAPRTDNFEGIDWKRAPHLKTLILSCGSTPDEGLPPSTPLLLFRGTAPLLENVTITRVKVAWSSSMWRNLKSLELVEVVELDLDRLLDILEACPRLHTLMLHTLPLSQQHDGSSHNRSPFSLSALKSLTLESITGKTLALLLAKLRCPQLERLRLLASTPVVEDLDIQIITTFVLDFLRQIRAGESDPTITVGNSDIQISTDNTESPELVIGFEGLGKVAEGLCQSSTFPITKVTLLEGADRSGEALAALKNRQGVTTLATRLNDVIDKPFDDGSWPFTHLHTLIIHPGAFANANDVLQMVCDRMGRWREAVELPAVRVKKLVLAKGCPMDKNTFWRIAAVLGAGILLWEDEPELGH